MNSSKFQENFNSLLKGMSGKKTAKCRELNIEYDVFNKIIEYGRIPKPVILIRIADYFNISIENLLGRTEDIFFEPAEFRKTFLERYLYLKDKHGMTDYEIAVDLHITTSYISHWKKYNLIPSIENIIYLSQTLETSIDFLLGRTDDEKPYKKVLDWC